MIGTHWSLQSFNIYVIRWFSERVRAECIQGFTFPVKELFLEDVLELTHFPIVADQGGFNGGGGGGRRRKAQEKAQDPVLETFEV